MDLLEKAEKKQKVGTIVAPISDKRLRRLKMDVTKIKGFFW